MLARPHRREVRNPSAGSEGICRGDGSVISGCPVAQEQNQRRAQAARPVRRHRDTRLDFGRRVRERPHPRAGHRHHDARHGDRRLRRPRAGLRGRPLRASAALAHAQSVASAELTTPNAPPKEDGVPHFATERDAARRPSRRSTATSPARACRSIPRPCWSAAGSCSISIAADEAAGRLREAAQGKLDDRLKFLAERGSATPTSPRGSSPRPRRRSPSWATTPAGFYKDRALYHEARLAELRGNPATPIASITRCWKRLPPPRCAKRSRIASPSSR